MPSSWKKTIKQINLIFLLLMCNSMVVFFFFVPVENYHDVINNTESDDKDSLHNPNNLNAVDIDVFFLNNSEFNYTTTNSFIEGINDTIIAVYDDDRPIMKMSEEAYIPRILHIQWKSSKLPAFASKNLKLWRKYHPNWTVMLWTDKEMESFAKRKFSVRSYNLYNKIKTTIQKVDLFRYLILHHFGGVYADIDISWESSFELLRTRHACIVCREPEAHSVSIGLDESVLASNFVLASRRGHPFWLHFLHEIFAKIERKKHDKNTLAFAGPLGITRALDTYNDRFRFVDRSNSVFLAPSIYFMPRKKDDKGDVLHITMLKNACNKSPERIRRSSKFKQRICNIVRTEGRIDFSDMYKHPRYFNLNGLQPFTKHHLFNSWDKPRFSQGTPIELSTIVGNYTTFSSLIQQYGIGKYYGLPSAFDRATRLLNGKSTL